MSEHIRFFRIYKQVGSKCERAMNNHIEYYLEIMKNTCSELKDEHLQDFARTLYAKKYSGKIEIFGLNAYHDTIGFITKGLARAYYITPKGDEKTVNFIKENEFLTDYAAFLSGKQSRYIFETLLPSIIVFLPKAAIYASYEKHPVIQKYGRLIAESIIQKTQKQMESLLFLSAKERYLEFLKDNGELVNKISIRDMASLIGIERQSLTRIRKQLLSEK